MNKTFLAFILSTASACGATENGAPASAHDGGGQADCQTALRTGDPARDAYDCLIFAAAEQRQEPDAMIIKAQVYQESNFDVFAMSPEAPCLVQKDLGWTDVESKSFGLMQLTPACGWLAKALRADGHPNLEQNATSDMWPTSVFNPTINVEEGVRVMALNRVVMMVRFPDCSESDYTRMTLGGFNRGPSSVTGCNMMTGVAQEYVNVVLSRYRELAAKANWPNRYQ